MANAQIARGFFLRYALNNRKKFKKAHILKSGAA